MGKENLVTYRDVVGEDGEVGQEFKLDLDSGKLYTTDGTLVEQWEPVEHQREDDLGACADFAASYAGRAAAYSMSLSDKGRAAHMLATSRAMLSGGDPERLVTMDLGITDVHIPSAMPNFASGYKNEPPIADLVAPPLLGGKQSDSYFQYDKNDAFQRAQPMGAAARGDVPEISPRVATATYNTKERALGGWVSTQLEANADVPLKPQLATTRRIMNALMIERELRVANLVQTSTNWDSSVVTTLTSGFQWNGGASSNPVKDIHAQIRASWGEPTGLIIGLPLWHALQENASVRSYHQFTVNPTQAMTTTYLSELFGVPVYVGKMQYIDTSGNKSYIWGNSAVLIRQPEQMPPQDQEDVATCYTFRWNVANPKDGVSSGGFIVRQFFVQHRGSMGGLKTVVVHHDDERMTSTFVGGLIVGAYQ